MELLFKLLRQNISAVQLIGFVLVNLVGGIIFLMGFQAYRDFDSLSHLEEKLLSSSYIVITKPVSALSTVSTALGGRQAFSRVEIDELNALSSVSSVGEFRTSFFEVTALVGIDGKHSFHTDLFLDAVPDEFVMKEFGIEDNGRIKWDASIDDDTIPMMIPRNYLNLYNYGFAASKQLPALSETLVQRFPIKLRIETPQGTKVYNARICGLTTKINTILVPWNFINSANETFAPGTKMPPSRLILTTDAREIDDSVLEYIKENGYVIEGDSSHVRLQNFIYAILYVVICVGFVFSFLAFFMLVISIQLLIEKNKEKIATLFSMGYSVRNIAIVYQSMSSAVDVVVWLLSATAATVIYPRFTVMIVNSSPGFMPESLWSIWVLSALSALLFSIMHGFVIYRQIRIICKTK